MSFDSLFFSNPLCFFVAISSRALFPFDLVPADLLLSTVGFHPRRHALFCSLSLFSIIRTLPELRFGMVSLAGDEPPAGRVLFARCDMTMFFPAGVRFIFVDLPPSDAVDVPDFFSPHFHFAWLYSCPPLTVPLLFFCFIFL